GSEGRSPLRPGPLGGSGPRAVASSVPAPVASGCRSALAAQLRATGAPISGMTSPIRSQLIDEVALSEGFRRAAAGGRSIPCPARVTRSRRKLHRRWYSANKDHANVHDVGSREAALEQVAGRGEEVVGVVTRQERPRIEAELARPPERVGIG